ncbi:MAG: hypothetical protein HYT71_00330 [Candidatus Aenigmarchaeota archaeon]|nr:hypothetical protein [Candidatus Aenigmarchaeota archaeon]
MKFYSVTAILLVISTIMVSGCTDTNDGTPAVKNNEIVILENVEAVPNEIKPDRNFAVSGFVTNKAAAKTSNVQISLADYCSSVFDVSKTSCALTQSNGYSACFFDLNLDASKKFQWDFKAPPASRTAGQDFDCNIIVKTNYSYTSHGSVGVVLANDAEIAARENGPAPVTGDGPVKIHITVDSAQPIGKDETFDVKIILKNEGEGELEGSISEGNFKYTAPPDFTGSCDTPAEIIISDASKESDPFYCTFTTPNLLPPRVTKFITADVVYSYKFTTMLPVKLKVTKQS